MMCLWTLGGPFQELLGQPGLAPKPLQTGMVVLPVEPAHLEVLAHLGVSPFFFLMFVFMLFAFYDGTVAKTHVWTVH